jgi:hypothetical protein
MRECKLSWAVKCNCQSLLSQVFHGKYKKGRGIFVLDVYGRFLISNIASTAPTKMTAIIMPATDGRKYESIVVTGILVGSVVAAGAGSIDIAVSAYDGQYELEPAKVAMIVYCPGMSGGTHL